MNGLEPHSHADAVERVWGGGQDSALCGCHLLVLLRHIRRLEVDFWTDCRGSTPSFQVHHCIWRLTCSCPSWVTWDILFSLSVTQFPCFKNGDNVNIYLTGLFWGCYRGFSKLCMSDSSHSHLGSVTWCQLSRPVMNADFKIFFIVCLLKAKFSMDDVVTIFT